MSDPRAKMAEILAKQLVKGPQQVFKGFRGVNNGSEFGIDPKTNYQALHAAKSSEVAESYANSVLPANRSQSTPAIYPVEMRFENPMIGNAKNKVVDVDRVVEIAKKRGHDGLVLRNARDNPDMDDHGPVTDIYAAINRGTVFDRNGKLLWGTAAASPFAPYTIGSDPNASR